MPQNALVRLIYEAANDPSRWDAFLTKFAEALHAPTAGLLVQERTGKWAIISANVGMDPETCRAYEKHFVSRNPWLLHRTVTVGNVETGEQILSNRELVKTEFYKDFLRPHRWLHGCSIVMGIEDSVFASIYALRPPADKAFTSGELELCSYLAPHLETAGEIHRRIASLEDTVQRLSMGMIDVQTLAELGLTPAETRLALAVFKGQSVEAYAKEAAISIGTARWHVKRIYSKTGVKRQSELIQLLLKSTARNLK